MSSLPRILVADDDESVRALCVSALMRSGYLIDAATNGREAIEQIENNDYDAILLDLTMPYVHGSTVAALLRQKKPEMMQRLIVISGAPESVVDPLFAQAGAVLRKPITIEMLRSVVAEVMKPKVEDSELSTLRL
jgi:CheY-like chemotaxis protein